MTIALVVVEVLSSEYTLWPIFDRLLYQSQESDIYENNHATFEAGVQKLKISLFLSFQGYLKTTFTFYTGLNINQLHFIARTSGVSSFYRSFKCSGQTFSAHSVARLIVGHHVDILSCASSERRAPHTIMTSDLARYLHAG